MSQIKALVLFVFLLTACGPPSGLDDQSLDQAQHTESPPATIVLPSAHPVVDMVIIGPEMSDQTISLGVGQVIFITNPNTSFDWDLAYAAEILMPVEILANTMDQETEGWYLQAAGEGGTDLTLDSVLRCSNPPCPPAQMRIVYSIEVKP